MIKSPGEHLINGRQFEVEIQILHKLDEVQYNTSKGLQ
jgi:carbonic anhydrase